MAKLRKKFTGVLMVNLAVCDILLVLFGILPDMLDVYDRTIHSSNLAFCKLINPLATCQVNAISVILVVISIERYVTIKHNKRPINGLVQQSIATVLINLFSIATVLPYMATLHLSTSDSNTVVECVETWSITARKIYTIILFLIQVGIPLPVMVILYLLSWRIIKMRNTKTIKVLTNNITHSLIIKTSVQYSFMKLSAPKSKYEDKLQRNCSMTSEASIARQKQTKYYLKMFTCVVVLFAICMLPNQITWFYIEFEPKRLSVYTELIFYWLTFANAVLNPWIYAGCNPFFKRAYKHFMKNKLSSCVCKQKRRDFVKLTIRCISNTETSDTLIGLKNKDPGVQSIDENESIENASEQKTNKNKNSDSDFPWSAQDGWKQTDIAGKSDPCDGTYNNTVSTKSSAQEKEQITRSVDDSFLSKNTHLTNKNMRVYRAEDRLIDHNSNICLQAADKINSQHVEKPYQERNNVTNFRESYEDGKQRTKRQFGDIINNKKGLTTQRGDSETSFQRGFLGHDSSLKLTVEREWEKENNFSGYNITFDLKKLEKLPETFC